MNYINDSNIINDSTLINNFYSILSDDFEFDELFKQIGINPKIKLDKREIALVKKWIKNNNTEFNPEIELLNQLEIFRDISWNPKEFDNQLKSIIYIYELLIQTFKDKHLIDYDLDFLDYEGNLEYLKRGQDLSFSFKDFKRDNIIHQLRVFLLGCFIINYNKEFWIKQTWDNVLQELGNVDGGSILPVLNEAFKFKLGLLGIPEDKFKNRNVFFMWLIASLFHDVGRSIQDANETIKKISDSILRIPNFQWTHLKSSKGTKEICELCPSCMRLKPDEIGEEKKKSLMAFIEWLLTDEKKEYIKNVIETKYKKLDHGVISAVLTTDNELFKDYIKFHWDTYSRRPFRIIFLTLVHYSLISISLHNVKKCFFISPLTQLLVLVDTLQEWDRITKIEDTKNKFSPCDHIEIKISQFDINSSKCLKIEAIIPYEEPEDDILVDIFKRRKPNYKELIEDFKISKSDKDVFKSFFVNGIEIRIGFIEVRKYSFSWDENPCNDDERIIEFLKDELKIEWAKTENISKIDGDKTIIISNKEKSLSLKLNDKKTKVDLIIDDVRVNEFTVKTENGKLKIYVGRIIKLKICGYCGEIICKEDELKNTDLSDLICTNDKCEAYGRN